MKSQTQLLILAVLLVLVIILVSVFSCSNFVPYSSNSLFSRYSKYEGFEANSTNVGSALVNDKLAEEKEKEGEEEEKKVEGFEGLKPAPFNEDKPLDSFSKTPGSLECEKMSSGLSNEKGGLCLSDEQIQSLVTRGGNATVQSKI